MSTSPGFPFSVMGKGGKKQKLFEFINERYYPRDEITQDYYFLRDSFAKGIIPIHPWVDCLKDERRSIEKVALCKTRLFSAAPLSFILLQKIYYGCFLQHMIQLRIKIFSRIGINKDSLEWDEHMRRLFEVSDTGVDIDYSNKDGNNRIDNVELFFDLADWWYERVRDFDQEEINIRRSIREMETHSYHLFFDKTINKSVIYQVCGRTNSGTLITAGMNSVTTEIDMRLAWLKLAPVSMRDLYYYKRFVRTAIVGDDLMLSISNHVREFYNPQNIILTLAEEGSKLTPGTKTGEVEFKPLEECSFLKNTSGKFMGHWVPLMEVMAMLEPINWIRDSELS